MLSKEDKDFLINLVKGKNINSDTSKEPSEEEPTKEDLWEALSMACQEIRNQEQGKTNARFKIQKLKNSLFVEQMSYEDFFIEQVLRKKKEEKGCK